MNITDELNELIALHGNVRDALNVTLAKLRHAESEIAALKEAAQHSVQADGLCPNCGRDYFENETILPNGELGCNCARL